MMIPQGLLQGKEISLIRTQRIYGFLGIPYAKPPLRELRFAPPKTEDLPAWNGIRNATDFAKPCLQAEKYKSEDMAFMSLITEGPIDSDEDCLYLNVFVPYGESKSRLIASVKLYFCFANQLNYSAAEENNFFFKPSAINAVLFLQALIIYVYVRT